MVQLIVLALLGVGAYLGYRWARKRIGGLRREAAARRQAQLPARKGGADPQDLGTLEVDPATGVYRPTERADGDGSGSGPGRRRRGGDDGQRM